MTREREISAIVSPHPRLSLFGWPTSLELEKHPKNICLMSFILYVRAEIFHNRDLKSPGNDKKKGNPENNKQRYYHQTQMQTSECTRRLD